MLQIYVARDNLHESKYRSGRGIGLYYNYDLPPERLGTVYMCINCVAVKATVLAS